MAFADDAKKILALASTGLHGLETIGEILRPLLTKQPGTEEVMGAVRVVVAILDTLEKGFEGNVSIENVYAELATAQSKLADNDRRVDADLDAKFPR